MLKKVPLNTDYFTYENLNPKNHRDGDCVIRAIAKATDQTWYKVYQDLVDIGLKYGYMPNSDEVTARYLTSLGWTKMKEPRNCYNRKYMVKDWIDVQLDSEDGLDSKIIASVGSHHLTTIIAGKVVDIWNCSRETMHTYWVKR